MTDFHDKPYHSKSDHAGDPNKPQEGSHKTSFAFVSDIHIDRRFTVGRENGGSISVHIFEDTAMADHTSER